MIQFTQVLYTKVSRIHRLTHRKLSPHGDQPGCQGISKLSDVPPSTSNFPHEKLGVLTDKFYTISIQYEV